MSETTREPQALEERDREAVRRMAARIVSEGQPWRFAVPGNVELLAAEVSRLTAERDAAEREMVTHARAAGEAEGRLLGSEMAGVVDGWRARARAAEARADRLEEALTPFVRHTARVQSRHASYDIDGGEWPISSMAGGVKLYWSDIERARRALNPEGGEDA